MNKILVSFSTRPGSGGEGGVGWAFVRAAISYSKRHEVQTHLVVDRRDEAALRAALLSIDGAEHVHLHAVALPSWAEQRFGDRRTRGSYLAWLPRARRRVTELISLDDIDVVHQVTFATAALPSVLPRTHQVLRVWGPVALPFQAVRTRGAKSRWWREIPVAAARWLGILNSRRADLLLATNDITARDFLRRRRRVAVEVEPNIAVDVDGVEVRDRDPYLLSISGLLIDRKRPWIAIEAMAVPALADYRLQVIGDGPLRPDLENLVDLLGVRERVTFQGHLPHHEALAELRRSRLLLHPAAREGAAWVIGEAAALGVRTVGFSNVGSASTVRLSNNGGVTSLPKGDPAVSLAEAAGEVLALPNPEPVDRWTAERFVNLLEDWWSR